MNRVFLGLFPLLNAIKGGHAAIVVGQLLGAELAVSSGGRFP